MNDREVATPPPSVWTMALFGVAALFTVIAFRFAVQQSVWTDEATQLSGLSLGFADQLRWLAGRLPQAFTVPIDRTPPLSYWLGSLWIHALGNGVLTARWLSVALSVGSVFAMWAVARQYLERRTALICSALLALSPNFVVEAAEIRAYAAFILFATLMIYCYLRLLAVKPTPSTLDLWSFAVVATLCSYTHFFGIVISAGAFLSLLILYRSVSSWTERSEILRKAKWPLVFYLIGMVGLIPFILAAVRNSSGGKVGTTALAVPFSERSYDLAKLAYRMFSHQAMLGLPGLSLAALLAGLTLMVFAAIPGANARCRPLLLYSLVNFILITLAGLTTTAFSAFSPTYNVWALPVTALLAGTALTHRNHHIRAVSAVCISILIGADCYAALRLSTAGDIYAHTRTSVVKAAVDSANPNDAIVLYGNDAPAIYFAMIYDFHGKLRQYIARGSSVHLIGSPVDSVSPWICDRNAGTLLIADDQELSAEALQFLIAHPGLHTQAYHALAQFLETHREDLAAKWTLVSRNEYLSQTALALAVFKGRIVDESQTSANCNAAKGSDERDSVTRDGMRSAS